MSLELSDTRVYEPQIRARIGTTAHFRPRMIRSPHVVEPGLFFQKYRNKVFATCDERVILHRVGTHVQGKVNFLSDVIK